MKEFVRVEAPDFLVQNWVEWGERFQNARNLNPDARFQWSTHQGRRIDLILRSILKEQSSGLCSYCNNFTRDREESIDHFKPKSHFPLEVCRWENLYFACSNCQSHKRNQYFEGLLHPDAIDYSFERYFNYDFTEHKIIPRPDLTKEEFWIANESLRIFGLNEAGNCKARELIFQGYWDKINDPDADVPELPFKFIFDLI